MPKLVVVSEQLKDKTFELTGDRISIGRLPDNIVQMEDTAVSSHHAELIQKGEDYVIRDLNSTNGTRVNGQRILETRLYHGDTIHFGQLEVQYLSSAKVAPQPLPSSRKKIVDLTASQAKVIPPPTAFKSSSPFSKNRKSHSKMIFQMVLISLGVIAAILLAVIIVLLLKS